MNTKSASVTNAIVKAPIVFMVLVVLAVALLRPTGPVTVNGDINVRQEVNVSLVPRTKS